MLTHFMTSGSKIKDNKTTNHQNGIGVCASYRWKSGEIAVQKGDGSSSGNSHYQNSQAPLVNFPNPSIASGLVCVAHSGHIVVEFSSPVKD